MLANTFTGFSDPLGIGPVLLPLPESMGSTNRASEDIALDSDLIHAESSMTPNGGRVLLAPHPHTYPHTTSEPSRCFSAPQPPSHPIQQSGPQPPPHPIQQSGPQPPPHPIQQSGLQPPPHPIQQSDPVPQCLTHCSSPLGSVDGVNQLENKCIGLKHGMKLWQFLLHLLLEGKHPSVLRWVSK